jgi:uncharacterized protein YjiK
MPRRTSAALRLSLREERPLPVASASGIAVVDDETFLVVDDDRGVMRIRGARAASWAGRALDDTLGDLEGICIDARGHVFVVAERSGRVLRLGRATARRRDVQRLGALPRPPAKKKAKRNKGWEGLAALSAALAPDGRDGLVLVHEARPKRIALVDVEPLRVRRLFHLPDDADALVDDLADVAVDPLTGHLLLLSEESRRILEVAFAGEALRLVGDVEVPVGSNEKPEGIAFASPARLVIVTDATSRMLTFDVRR